MDKNYFFNDVLDKNGKVAKEKISNCTFSHLKPGDYVGISFGWYSEDDSGHRGTVFVKVVSVTMPKAVGFFSGNSGQVKVVFPDGTTTDLLVYKIVDSYYPTRDAYTPTKAICEYFNKNCFPEKGGFVNTTTIEAYPSDKKALLKERMEFEFERRKNRKQQILFEQSQLDIKTAELKRQEQLRLEKEKERNAAITDEELNNLFHSN